MEGEHKANNRRSRTSHDLLGAPGLPTTRDVARLWERDGVSGLPDALRRGDDATYQEIVCRSALNRVRGMPFKWTLNPYRGCTHGCHYCFARRYQAQLEMGPGDEFSSVILVKVNFPDVLRRELRRAAHGGELVAVGTATDPYQPIEGRYRLTRRTLEAFAERPTPLALVTKGPLVVRDVDVLAALARATACTVSISVPTVDEDAWRRLEPGTAHPLQRLRAVRALADAGVDAGVLMAPIVPGISSARAKLEATVRAVADHGVRFVGAGLLHLEGGARAHFLEFLAREYPALVAGYGRLYAGKYAAAGYTEQVNAVLGTLRSRYGLTGRAMRPRATETPAATAERPEWRQQRLPSAVEPRVAPRRGRDNGAARAGREEGAYRPYATG